MMKTLLSIFISLLSSSIFSAEESWVRITPIVGYERIQKFAPTLHTKDRLIYGVRANVGPSYFSAEGEVTQGKDSEDFPDQGLTISEQSYKLKLGFRAGFEAIAQIMRISLRAGFQARQTERTKEQFGLKTSSKDKILTHPYAGGGFTFHISTYFSLQGGITVIFTDLPNPGDKEYQTTLGLKIKI